MTWVKAETRSGHPDHVLSGLSGLIWFINYPGQIQILHWIMALASGPDQSNELSVLDGDDESISPDSLQDI